VSYFSTTSRWPDDIVNAKDAWLKVEGNFQKKLIEHFEPEYREEDRFVTCVSKLRQILYQNDDNDGEDDPMKEGLFWICMKEVDDYLYKTKGYDEMQWIDSRALARHTPDSLVQEGNRVD
jgi:hypothetical protein